MLPEKLPLLPSSAQHVLSSRPHPTRVLGSSGFGEEELALFPSFHYYYIYSAVTFVSLRIHIWLSFPNYTKFDPFRLLYSGECES